ncbi:B12-binding domain-containing radical SAM protein [Youngiibacter fragilis]|uniref:Radical SAM protein n=1 Tax=Youngiibacter fragilis 232.1 TaxID=994573 RepID=V7I4H5_9CLOT|nr:B12-binding domain-containing radical SAM protein [Youngiibacter fragilis]ETA81130.1 radical SAM protein [Youngiibacter fragilis 232.1]
MDVLLVRPRPDRETIGLQHVMVCEPLELEYLVSNVPDRLRQNVNLEICDMILEKEPFKGILMRKRPDLVVFTGYITHVGTIKAMCAEVKRLLPVALTGVGGVHAEVVPDDFRDESIDFVYQRNGIDGFNLTLEGMLEGRSASGIRNRLESSEDRKLSFLYRHPDREAVRKYRQKYYYMFHRPCALIKTSYGCPYNCSFCFCKEITGGKYFTRDLKDVMDELEGIAEKEVYIVDDDFLFSKGRIREFLRLLKERGIEKKFLVYGRADFVAENRDLLGEFRDQGLQAVIVGLESIRGQDLDSYKKGTDIDVNERAVRVLLELGIELYATLIIPLDFSRKDFRDLTSWVRGLGIRFVNLQPLTPLPGTSIFHEYEDKLLYPRERYEMWDMAHVVLKPEHMGTRSFYLEIVKAYYRVVMRPKNVLALIRRYGLGMNLKMLAGSSRVTMQYLGKVVRGI